jgi:hypothetical protein
VKSTVFGSIPVGASKPTQPGVVAACGSPQWDESIAPPKLTSYTYDDVGRVMAIATEWTGATAGDQPGIETTGTDLTFELTSALPSEEICGLVLQKTATDVQGHSTESRVCVQNSFPLSKADQEGRRVFYEHADSGLTTRVTDPNGSFKTFDYYYACPDGPDGTPTCPSGFANLGSCPYGDSSTARSCTVQTQYAGTNPTSGEANESFVDGVIGVDIKDGLGRSVQTLDNLGADDSFSAYAAIQTRSRSVFDDRNLVVEQTKEVGALSPLVYTTTTEFGPKQRPQLSCDPRGVSHEFVRDDVGQHVKRTFNGHQVSRISSNDGHKVTRIVDCPIVGETTVSAGACPVATASTSSAMCTGDVFLTDIARDGAGNQRGITASAASAEASGASVASVSAETRYGADLVKYDFEIEGTATSTGQSVHAETSWTKDLRGSMLSSDITVDGVSTSQFASTRFESDELGNQIAQSSPLAGSLMESNLFTPSRQLASHTDFAGSEFQTFYDDMNRPFRHCYPDGDGGFEGERFTRDAITGAVTSVVHFQNASACDACESGDCGDVDTSMVGYTYTRFGQVLLKVYVDALQSAEPRTTFLQWGYDEYQRPICFADAAATILGSRCPPSPVPSDWVPEPEEQLAYLRYWEDSDPHRRGLLKSACRGVAHREEGAIVYETQCFDQDYYPSLDSEGSCDGVEAQGAYASLLKSSMLCRGGSCLEGSGQAVYTSTHLYDAHRRECSVTMRDPEDRIILDSRYAYDHFDNVITETHTSDLDTSDGSNYSVTYAYDGLLRLIGSDRSDSDGSAIESYEYEYDAASNITKKVKTTYE